MKGFLLCTLLISFAPTQVLCQEDSMCLIISPGTYVQGSYGIADYPSELPIGISVDLLHERFGLTIGFATVTSYNNLFKNNSFFLRGRVYPNESLSRVRMFFQARIDFDFENRQWDKFMYQYLDGQFEKVNIGYHSEKMTGTYFGLGLGFDVQIFRSLILSHSLCGQIGSYHETEYDVIYGDQVVPNNDRERGFRVNGMVSLQYRIPIKCHETE